jgi:DNA-binding XRE family transcriptional regulator
MPLESQSELVNMRDALGLTQKEIADELGVTEQTVRNWEHGRSVPKLTIPQTKRLCRLLRKSLEDLPDSFGPPKAESA